MSAKNHLLVALFLGSLFVETSNAIPFDLSVPLVAQQPDAPGTFTLALEDNYRTIGGETFLKFSLLNIVNGGPAESRIMSMFIFDPAQLIGGGSHGGDIRGNGFIPDPSVVPVSIADAIDPNFWFTAGEDGIAPGELCQWAADPSHSSLIDAFNSGNLKVGIQLADGHTYVASIPDGGSTALMLAGAFIVFGLLTRKSPTLR